jgi:hypothetical protein
MNEMFTFELRVASMTINQFNSENDNDDNITSTSFD